MHLMHRAFLVPPNRRAGPGPVSSSLPGRAVQLDVHSANGKGSVPWGDLVWEKEAPPSRRRLPPHWPRPGHTASPGRSLGTSVVGLPCPLEGEELGRWVSSGRQRELVRKKAISARGRACQQGRAVDGTTCLSLRLPSMGRESLQSSGTQEEVLPREGRVLRLCVGWGAVMGGGRRLGEHRGIHPPNSS